MSKQMIRMFALIIATFTAMASYAQRTVTGTIKDENDLPLIGSTVSVKGTKAQTTTDVTGKFSLSVPEGTRALHISHVGMQPIDFPLGTGDVLNIQMRPSSSSLNEVVVVGYGTRRRAEVTSSISSVTARDLRDQPVAGLDQAIQGKIAGVTVTNNSGQPGGGVSVRVRGITSVNNNEPLYVIDGVQIGGTNDNTIAYNMLGGSGGQTSNSVLASLNPNDIESVDVLKDASAQAIYGSRAANGVVIINTKRGRAGEGRINYEAYYGIQTTPKKLDMMNLREFARYQNEVAALTGMTATPEFANPDALGEGTNWQDAIFQTGKIQNHQISFSGGQNKTNYYFSGNYFDQTGIIIGSNFRRYALRFNLDHQVKSWFRAGISANATKSNQKLTLADEQDGTVTQALLQSPLIPVRNLDKSWGGPGTNIAGIVYFQDNPVAKSEMRDVKSDRTRVIGNLYGDILIGKGLSIRNEFGYDFQLTNNMAFQRQGMVGNTPLQSHLIENKSTNNYWAFRTYANYNRVLGGVHSISATAGHEAQSSSYDYMNGDRYNLATNDLVALNAGDQLNQTLSGGKGHWAMESYFVRAGYSYNDRYSINLSYRADASSVFGPNNKWGYFPAASIGWTISNEAFAQNWKSVNFLKLRFGLGSVGNQNAPSGAPSPPYTANVRFTTNGFGAGNFPRNIPNPDLKWESVVTYNGGVDVSFLNRRVDLTIDVYKKITKDMLLFSSAPRFTGIGSAWNDVLAPVVNAGQMTNTGFDLSLTTYNINQKNFTWKTNVIFSHYKNNLDNLINSSTSIDGTIIYGTTLITHTVQGQPVGSYYGLVTDGLFRTMDELANSLPQFGLPIGQQNGTWLGDVRFKDLNGDKVIDEKDITFIGSPHPKFTFGITNSFSYRGFDASIFLQGSQGGKIFNYLRRGIEGLENNFYNQLSTVTDRYSATNTDGSLPRFTSNNKNNNAISDRYVEDGSYLRIQNISLGYTFSKSLLSKASINNFRVYVALQNIYTFTGYSGFDPEIGSFNKSITLMNVDNGHYPNPRSITIGANIEF